MINLGLKRTTRLLQHIARDIFGQPDFRPLWKAVHIAGTNGKGSVAAYLSALLRRGTQRPDGSSLRIGRFTSPHFIDRWDCITIDDEAVSEKVFLHTEDCIKKIATRVADELREQSAEVGDAANGQSKEIFDPTEFEILAATAFTLFSQSEPRPCDIAVIECGLGGRLDATNALPDSAIAASVLTRFGLDHVDILGGSLESIASEKAGILRLNKPVIIDGTNETSVKDVIYDEMNRKFADLNESFEGEYATRLASIVGPSDLDQILINRSSDLRVARLMAHQKVNLAIAFRVKDILVSNYAGCLTGFPLAGALLESTEPASSLPETVLADAAKSYPARLQRLEPRWLDKTPDHNLPSLNEVPVLLDGAHNEQSAIVLREFVDGEIAGNQSADSGLWTSTVTGRLEYTSTETDLDHFPISSPDAVSPPQTATPFYKHEAPSRPIIWILALSSSKPPAEILHALFPYCPSRNRQSPDWKRSPKANIIFTSFGPVDNMPWVKATSLTTLEKAAEKLGLAANVVATTSNIVEALNIAESLVTLWKEKGEVGEPYVVVAGSLYLASDFLRFVRDGEHAFMRRWNRLVG